MIFHEDEHVELKEVPVDAIKREVVAFANSDGGTVYVGVTDGGVPVGLGDPDGDYLKVGNMVRDGIYPDVTRFVHFEMLDLDGAMVLAVFVQRGTNRPYCVGSGALNPGKVFVRVGASSPPASAEAIRQMIKETDGDVFEAMRSPVQDLTFTAMGQEFAKRKVALGPGEMVTLGLKDARGGEYTNLALLLSDQCPYSVKAAVFDQDNAFKDRKEFSGSLFAQMEAAYAYVDFYNRTRGTFAGLARTDTRDYPEEAAREALMNMLVHRDYSVGPCALIKLWADRLEFVSVGGLAPGLRSLADALSGASVCRNKRLAEVFLRLRLIEAYGTGLRKMIAVYGGTGLAPAFEVTDNVFSVALPNVNSAAETAPPAATGGKGGASGATAKRRRTNAENKAIVEGLAQRSEFITRQEVESALGLGRSSCNNLLASLVTQGRLIQMRAGKDTSYAIPRATPLATTGGTGDA